MGCLKLDILERSVSSDTSELKQEYQEPELKIVYSVKRLSLEKSSSAARSDYGARWYDPATARWSSVDPLAEKYYGYSGYNYVLGNPVKYIDPDGRDVFVRNNSTGDSYHLSTFGGDEIDFVYNVDIDASGNEIVTSINTMPVEFVQGSYTDLIKEPGLRKLPRTSDAIQSVAYETFFLPLPKIIWGSKLYKWLKTGGKGAANAGTAGLANFSKLSFKELQAINRSNSKAMNEFFKSGGKVVPSQDALQAYRELTLRILNGTGGAPASKASQTAIKVQSKRLDLINQILGIK